MDLFVIFVAGPIVGGVILHYFYPEECEKCLQHVADNTEHESLEEKLKKERKKSEESNYQNQQKLMNHQSVFNRKLTLKY